MKLEKLLVNDEIYRFVSNKYFSQACLFQNPFFITITAVIITLKVLKTKISECRSGFVDGTYLPRKSLFLNARLFKGSALFSEYLNAKKFPQLYLLG